MAENPLMSVSEEERERAISRSRRKFQTDLQSNFATAEDNGETQGKNEPEYRNCSNALQNRFVIGANQCGDWTYL